MFESFDLSIGGAHTPHNACAAGNATPYNQKYVDMIKISNYIGTTQNDHLKYVLW